MEICLLPLFTKCPHGNEFGVDSARACGDGITPTANPNYTSNWAIGDGKAQRVPIN